MNERLRRLREDLGKLAARIRQLADRIHAERRDFTSEENLEWDRVNKEYNAKKGEAERLARAAEIERELTQRVGDREVGREDTGRRAKDSDTCEDLVAQMLVGWSRAGQGLELSSAQARACSELGVNPQAREIAVPLRRDYGRLRREAREGRALGVGTGAAGGFTVPAGFVYQLELALLQYGGPREVADVLRTDSGNDMPWPTANDTGNSGELLGENTSFGASVDPSFGQVVMKAYKYSSKPVLASFEITEDSAFQMSGVIPKMLGERIGRIQGVHFTTGDNSSKPQGLITGAVLGKTAASATAIAADELFDLLHSVDPAYRKDPSCGWMMHDNILLAVRKLKDSQNRYLWQESMRVGEPDQLLGKPITINQHMASSIATTNKTVLFGAFGKYKIRDVNEIRFVRLVERYADLDQVGFIAFLRSDGRLLDAGTRPVKYLQQA